MLQLEAVPGIVTPHGEMLHCVMIRCKEPYSSLECEGESTFKSRDNYVITIRKALVAANATKRDLFALAEYPSLQHISPCLSGILSQNFQGPVGNDRALFSLPCSRHFGTIAAQVGLHCAGRVPSSSLTKLREDGAAHG
ncbi:MAG: hypothetical protein JY451_09665 [Erythrobacter sp.]|nr:MAG: hypothetical protein JY451_09665 [Erythrobacter sp.]